jgi:membrane-associated protease RseP (regulator of RpoE activity)
VEIDYERGVLSLSKTLPGDPSEHGHRFDLQFTAGIPVIAASVEMEPGRAVPVELLVDTGANAPLLLFGFSDERLRPAGPVVKGRERVLAEGLTGKMLGRLCRIPRLQLGPFVLSQVVTALPDEATMGGARQLGRQGMLGNEALQRFTVVFDYPASRMFLKPNGQYARRFEYNTAGLVMHGGKAWYEVEDVLEGSSAEQQGVRAGDRIVAIRGRPIQAYRGDEISEIFARRDTTIEITIERQSEQLRKVLALRRLI